MRHRRRDVRDLNIFGKNQRIEARGERRGKFGGHGDDDVVFAPEDTHVSDHAPLRCEVNRVACAANWKRLDVITHERLEKREGVFAREPKPAAVRSGPVALQG